MKKVLWLLILAGATIQLEGCVDLEVDLTQGELSGIAGYGEFRSCGNSSWQAPCYVQADENWAGCATGNWTNQTPTWSYSSGGRRATLLYSELNQTLASVQFLLRNGMSIPNGSSIGFVPKSWKSCLDITVPRYGMAVNNDDSPQSQEFIAYNGTGYTYGGHVLADREQAPTITFGANNFGSYKVGPNLTAVLWSGPDRTGVYYVMPPNTYKSSLAGTTLASTGVRSITFQ